MSDLTEIGKLINALRPWLHQVVFIGGRAHRLFRFHEFANPPNYIPVTTKDADVAFSLDEPLVGDIDDALKVAGFKADLRGDRTPPISHYHLEEEKGFYAEFLVPFIGGRTNRQKELVPLTIKKAGITAQKLRHLEILLIEPWTLMIDSSLGFDFAGKLQILIPNPVTFIAQKILIKHMREIEKQPQDALYVHDTLELFSTHLEELNTLWLDAIRPRIGRKTAETIERLFLEQFGETNDIHRNAVQIPQDRSMTAQNLQRACLDGLTEVFSSK